MKKLLLLLIFAAISFARADETTNQTNIVVLPVFRVIAEPCSVNYTVVAGRITTVEVSEVTPTAKLSASGLRPKDRLVSIDGKSVKEMKKDEFEKHLERVVEPGRPKVYTFITKRGLLGVRSKKIEMTISAKP